MAHTHNAADRQASIKKIWKTFWILLIITAVEVGMAFLHLETGFPNRMWLNALFIILTIFKAYYIVSEFMHLGHEIKNLVWTILMPLTLFIWFIIAFLADGDSWKHMRRNAPSAPLPTEKVAPAHGGGNHH